MTFSKERPFHPWLQPWPPPTHLLQTHTPAGIGSRAPFNRSAALPTDCHHSPENQQLRTCTPRLPSPPQRSSPPWFQHPPGLPEPRSSPQTPPSRLRAGEWGSLSFLPLPLYPLTAFVRGVPSSCWPNPLVFHLFLPGRHLKCKSVKGLHRLPVSTGRRSESLAGRQRPPGPMYYTSALASGPALLVLLFPLPPPECWPPAPNVLAESHPRASAHAPSSMGQALTLRQTPIPLSALGHTS